MPWELFYIIFNFLYEKYTLYNRRDKKEKIFRCRESNPGLSGESRVS